MGHEKTPKPPANQENDRIVIVAMMSMKPRACLSFSDRAPLQVAHVNSANWLESQSATQTKELAIEGEVFLRSIHSELVLIKGAQITRFGGGGRIQRRIIDDQRIRLHEQGNGRCFLIFPRVPSDCSRCVYALIQCNGI